MARVGLSLTVTAMKPCEESRALGLSRDVREREVSAAA